MTMRAFFRFVLPALLLGGLLTYLLVGLFTEQVRNIDTSVGFELLETVDVEQAKVVDGDQRVMLTLAEEHEEYGRLVQFFFIEPQGATVIDGLLVVYG